MQPYQQPQQPYPNQPYYPQQPGSPPIQPKRGRKGLWITLAIIAVIVIFGCIGMSVVASNAAKTVATTTATSANGNTSTSHHKVGETVSLEDTWQLTVNKVSTSTGQGYDQPKTGNRYLLVEVSLKNISQQSQDFSSLLQFDLRDAQGSQVNESITTFASAPNGKVAAGDPLHGTLAYEIPMGQRNFTLHFTASVTGDPAIYDIQA